MTENFESLVQRIESELPELVTPEMLLKLGLANHVIQFRLREKGAIPFLKLSNARVIYLKKDVIDWLKQSYRNPENAAVQS